VISIEKSEPWSQDHNHRTKFHLQWWHFPKSWNLKRHYRETPMKMTDAVTFARPSKHVKQISHSLALMFKSVVKNVLNGTIRDVQILRNFPNSQPSVCSNCFAFSFNILLGFRLFVPCIFCPYCNKVTNGCNCLFCFVFISFIYSTCFALS